MAMRTPVSSPTNRNYCSRMVTCFTCGLQASKKWTQKVSTRPNASDKPFFHFLAQIQLPLGSVLEADGSTVVCAFCYASLLAQWRHFEQQSAGCGNQSKVPRVYSLGKFICEVCGVTTYPKRVRTLPVEEFPFLLSQRPQRSLAFGNSLMALVCLDCCETLRTQNEEYDRWGFPLQKRRFNWLARPPPHPNSAEASVARLPCGKIKIPSCPPTEPSINPFILTDNRLANTTGVSTDCQSSSQVGNLAALPSGSEESGPGSRRRKLAAFYTENPFMKSDVQFQSPKSRTDLSIAESQTPWQGKHKVTPGMPIPSRPEMIYKRTLSSPSSTRGYRSRPILSVIPRDTICPQGSIRGSAQYISSSVPHGSVLVPAVIYHPRGKLSPPPDRRQSSALSIYTSAAAPLWAPVITTVKSCDSSRIESSSSMRVPCPKSSTVPRAPLNKITNDKIIRQKMEEAAITESHSTFRESIRFSITSGNEKGIPIRKRRVAYEQAELTAEVGSGGSSCSCPWAGQIMLDESDSDVYSIGNEEQNDSAIDLSISSRKCTSIYSSDSSLQAGGGFFGDATTEKHRQESNHMKFVKLKPAKLNPLSQ